MRVFRGYRVLLSVLLPILGGTGMLACAPPLDDEFTAECSLPTDQKQSITGRWPTNPVFISFRDGQFSAYEMGLIMDAADVWNQFFGATSGIRIIDYGTRSFPRVTTRDKPVSLCSNSLLSASGGFTGSVTIYKQTTWPSTYSSGAIAITSNCSTTASPMDKMYIAIMELNFQHFFVSGRPVPDTTSIFVHEFGHLLGLDHSCTQSYDSASKTHPPLCSSSSLDAEYYRAVMFPVVNFNADGTGLIRRSLGSNDQGRANCLYGGKAL